MALAVLRLIGEELRKDRTARVITQLPVEVATYLFNEKREWLRTLEGRGSTELVIVPNPHIQTPEYSIKRVREDEADLPENRQTSYLMPVAPEAAEPGSARDKRPPAEAPAVATLLPATPAPIMAPPAEASTGSAESRPARGFWSRLKGLFATESSPTEAATSETGPRVSAAAGSASHPGERTAEGRREHARPARRVEAGRRSHGEGRGTEGRIRGRRDRDRPEHRHRDRDVNHRPPEGQVTAAGPAQTETVAGSAAPERSHPELPSEGRRFPGKENGTTSPPQAGGERRGRRRGRRGGRRTGAAREGGFSESASSTPSPAAGDLPPGGTASSERDTRAAASPVTAAPPSEAAEPRRSSAPPPHETLVRHEEPQAPPVHFEPSGSGSQQTSQESKPYVVWSSTPTDWSQGGGHGSDQ